MNNLTDPSFTGTFLSSDVEHDISMHYLETKMAKRFVSAPIMNSYFTMGFFYPNLWDERLEEIIEGLITGGIINWHLEKYTKSKFNAKTREYSQKVVLNLSHLGFGFQICFYMLYIALLAFCMEIVIRYFRKKSLISNKVNINSRIVPHNGGLPIWKEPSNLILRQYKTSSFDDGLGEKVDFVLEYLQEFEQLVRKIHKN